MPRNIIIPEEQENQNRQLTVPSKAGQKRSSASSNFSQQDTGFQGRWRTNLLISQQVQRVQRRDQGYRKNTSFENKIINDHIKVMIQTVCEMQTMASIEECTNTCRMISCQQSITKGGIVKQRVEETVQSNTYLTEDQKSDFISMFCQNYDNYQIMTKTISRLEALSLCRQQLTFILFKIVEFITRNYEIKLRKYDQQFMQAQIPKKLSTVSNMITTHQNIKLINPEYFYNTNQSKYIKIIERWFYCIFAIKLGVYGNKYLRHQQEDMEIQM